MRVLWAEIDMSLQATSLARRTPDAAAGELEVARCCVIHAWYFAGHGLQRVNMQRIYMLYLHCRRFNSEKRCSHGSGDTARTLRAQPRLLLA